MTSSWYARNSLLPGHAPVRNPFLADHGRAPNAGRSQSLAPHASRRKSSNSNSTARSRSVPRRAPSVAPPPAVQFTGGAADHVEMSQLSDGTSGSVVSTSTGNNAPGPPFSKESLSTSTDASKKSTGQVPRFNKPRLPIQRTIKNEALFWKPYGIRNSRAQVTSTTQQRGGSVATKAYNGSFSQMWPLTNQHAIARSNRPTMNQGSSRGLSQASFGGSTVSRRLSQSSHSASSTSQGNNRAVAQTSRPGALWNLYQGSGRDFTQASASTLSTVPSTKTGSTQQERLAEDAFMRAQVKFESFLQEKMKELNAGGQRTLQEIEGKMKEMNAGGQRMLQEMEGKMKIFDNQQHAFYNRISSAEEEHIERLEEFKTKIAAANAQIENFDVVVADAHDQHQARNKELDSKVSKFDAMYSKACELVKTVEKVAESGISSINQVRSDVADAVMPYLKQPVFEMVKGMMTVSLPFSSSMSSTTVATPTTHKKDSESTLREAVKSMTSDESENLQHKSTSKKRTSPASTEQGPPKRKTRSSTPPSKNFSFEASSYSTSLQTSSTRKTASTTTKKSKTVVCNKEAPKRKTRSGTKTTTANTGHPRKAAGRSPLAPLKFVNTVPSSTTKAFKQVTNRETYSSPAQTVKSCVTPCDKENADFLFSSKFTPISKKSSKQPGHGKRGRKKNRGRFGSVHPRAADLWDDFAFNFN